MRRKQRHIIAMFTLLTMFLPLLAGCGSNVPDLPGKSTQGAGEMTTEAPEVTTQEPVTERSTDEVPTTEEPVTEEPTTETPTTEEPTTEEPTTEAPAEPEELIEIEVSFDEIKREVLTVYPGREEGQVKYDELPSGTDGPKGFAIVDGVIYILDTANYRVNIYDNGENRSIPFKARFTRMIVQDGFIVLSDISNGTKIAVYRTDGTLEAVKEFEKSEGVDWINKFCCIGETYVEFASTSSYTSERYRYDWVEDKTTVLGRYEAPNDKVNETILNEQNHLDVIGEYGESVYYTYFDWKDEGPSEYFLNREEGNIRWYAMIDFYAWHAHPLEQLYLSADGKLYIMECFEDRTVISELLLGEQEASE